MTCTAVCRIWIARYFRCSTLRIGYYSNLLVVYFCITLFFFSIISIGNNNNTVADTGVVDSGAHLFVSVHANASDTSAGYLRAAGTSTFYKHPSAHDLAAAVQRRLLQATALPDFGLVGNFNYTPIRRATWAPAVLVEQAFMSNPAEEALLLDPGFRNRLAQAVRDGLEDFLRDSLPPLP